MTKYVSVEWPEYQFFMDKEDVHFCADENCYFVPVEMYEQYAYEDNY